MPRKQPRMEPRWFEDLRKALADKRRVPHGHKQRLAAMIGLKGSDLSKIAAGERDVDLDEALILSRALGLKPPSPPLSKEEAVLLDALWSLRDAPRSFRRDFIERVRALAERLASAAQAADDAIAH